VLHSGDRLKVHLLFRSLGSANCSQWQVRSRHHVQVDLVAGHVARELQARGPKFRVRVVILEQNDEDRPSHTTRIPNVSSPAKRACLKASVSVV
jgi:hypothetical protein